MTLRLFVGLNTLEFREYRTIKITAKIDIMVSDINSILTDYQRKLNQYVRSAQE